MNFNAASIRGFIGAKNYQESRSFYKALGFQELVVGEDMCLFKVNKRLSFYLQDYYVKDWVDNSMLLLEVDNIEQCQKELLAKNLQDRFKKVRFTEIKEFDHGRDLFMHDPSGVLWHFFQFKSLSSNS